MAGSSSNPFPIARQSSTTREEATISAADLLGLVRWVEDGTAPDSIPAAASTPGFFDVTTRTRPLCPYPTWAHYTGAGDINEAANFMCR